MHIETALIKRIRITEVENLDPITVIVEDFSPGKGKIVIECWGRSWAATWTAMGNRTISQFFTETNNSYLVNCLEPGIKTYEPDFEQYNKEVKQKICEMRRDSRGWEHIGFGISKELARALYEIEDWQPYHSDNPYEPILCPNGIDSDEFEKLDFGDFDVPEKLSTEYRYLELIVKTVKDALIPSKQQAA